jgi:hypothetical protein
MELETCPWIELTSSEEWNMHDECLPKAERKLEFHEIILSPREIIELAMT